MMGQVFKDREGWAKGILRRHDYGKCDCPGLGSSRGGLLRRYPADCKNALAQLGQSGVVYDISVSLLGIAGGALAIIGVVVCPVSSGDTAFPQRPADHC